MPAQLSLGDCVRRAGLKASLVLILFDSFLSMEAQSSGDWPPVSAAELALTDNPAMPGASAILLDRDSRVDDVKSVESEYCRIKIFTDEGRKFANIEIPYVEKQQEVYEVRARTVRPDGTAVEFSGAVFDRLIVKSKRLKYQAKVITLPEVGTGSIFEYSYKVKWHQHAPGVLKNPSEYLIDSTYSIPTMQWTLQHELFTRHARFTIRYLPKGNLQWALIRPPAGSHVELKPDGTAQLEIRDLPPMEKEELAPPENYINSRVHFFYVLGNSYGFWSELGMRQGKELEVFIGHSKTIEQATARIVTDTDSPEAKLRKIYKAVQQIRYVSYEPEKTEKQNKQENLRENKNVEDVWNHGYAFSNEINYLFVAMARAAGFQAWVVKLVDRSQSVLDRVVLDASQLNATVVMVKMGKDNLFLDPATRFCPYGLLPWAESGVRGLRISDFGADFQLIPAPGSDSAIIRRTASVKVDSNGTIEGKVQVAFAGEEALVRRLDHYDEDEAGRQKALEDEVKGWLPAGANVEISRVDAWEDSDKELKAEASFSVPEFATVSGRRLLVPLAVFQAKPTHRFDSARRTYPIYFQYSYRVEDDIHWIFPEGYRYESIPSAHSFQNDSFRYKTTLAPTAAGLDFSRLFSMDSFLFGPGLYGMIQDTFRKIASGDAEQAVLQQKAPGHGENARTSPTAPSLFSAPLVSLSDFRASSPPGRTPNAVPARDPRR
ncbi:MAG TPA: DUF3857 domain-containing protein [Terriglobales bacterium]